MSVQDDCRFIRTGIEGHCSPGLFVFVLFKDIFLEVRVVEAGAQ